MRLAALTIGAVFGFGAAAAGAADLVANRTLRVGAIVAAGDLRVEGSAGGADVGPGASAYLGLEARRIIFAGQPVAAADFGPPTLVRRNDVINLLYRAGAIELRTEARALAAGGLGERIAVMNLDSRTTVQARIVGPNAAEAVR